MICYFLEKCQNNGLNLHYLKAVTKSLIFGTFHALPVNLCKKNIWEWLKNI